MRTYLDCYPCFVRQALDASRYAGASEDQQYRVLREALKALRGFDKGATPPEMAYRIHRIVREETGEPDPFRAAKDTNTAEALSLYPRLKTLVAEAPDPLGMALRVSIAGNILDVGIGREYDLEKTIDEVLRDLLEAGDFHAFRHAMARAQDILFLADNAGETLFDRVLGRGSPIRRFGKRENTSPLGASAADRLFSVVAPLVAFGLHRLVAACAPVTH